MASTDILADLTKILEEYIHNVEGAESIFISTLDGNIILEVNKTQKLNDSLSPIAGSILGLAESLVNLVNGKQLHENITVMQDYIIGLFKIHDQEDSLFLGVKCNRMLSLGKMINFAKSSIEDINIALDSFNEIGKS